MYWLDRYIHDFSSNYDRFPVVVDVDAALDKNLDDMASGLARLKGTY